MEVGEDLREGVYVIHIEKRLTQWLTYFICWKNREKDKKGTSWLISAYW